MAERFVTFDITEVEEFIDNEENSNTRRKTKNNMALMSSFMAKEKENRQFEEILPQELDNYLSRFLLLYSFYWGKLHHLILTPTIFTWIVHANGKHSRKQCNALSNNKYIQT